MTPRAWDEWKDRPLTERVREARRRATERAGVKDTQQAFAQILGVDRSQANGWETGRLGIGKTNAARIEDKSGMPAELFTEPDDAFVPLARLRAAERRLGSAEVEADQLWKYAAALALALERQGIHAPAPPTRPRDVPESNGADP